MKLYEIIASVVMTVVAFSAAAAASFGAGVFWREDTAAGIVIAAVLVLASVIASFFGIFCWGRMLAAVLVYGIKPNADEDADEGGGS